MSDDKAQQEPSMEDILASIRRILSEDEAKEPDKEEAPPPPPPPPPPPEPEPEPEPMVMAEPEPEPESEEDVLELTDDMVAEEEPAMTLGDMGPEPEPEPEPFRFRAEPVAEDEDSLLAPPVQEASTSALSELARAVARERGIGLGNGGVTLEQIVREILRVLLKEWLDQNLPYMIERIVKKEIERMVNRAENL